MTRSGLFCVATMAVALHVVDDTFVQPQAATSVSDHLVAGVVPLVAAAFAIVAFRRLRAGAQATLALLDVGRLQERHGLTVLVPDEADRRLVHSVIYDELCRGVIGDRSRAQYQRIIAGLADRGAQGVLLGCTEIDLLVGPSDSLVPVFDTTRLHAQRAAQLALSNQEGKAYQ